MEKGSYCDRNSQFSEILTEPLNPRDINNVWIFIFIDVSKRIYKSKTME